MRRVAVLGVLLAAAMAVSPAARGQDVDDEFRVLATNLNAEAERAEICLVLSQPIDPATRSAIAAAIQLEKNGAKIPVSPRDLSLTSRHLCVQQLEHHHEYRLLIRKLRSRNGAKLEEPINLVVTVPGRKPALAFVAPAQASRLPRLGEAQDQEALLVRSLNLKSAQLTLYRIADRKLFPEAMQQIAQLSRAPTESLYFATHKGQNVWQSELVFKDTPDVEQKLEAPLPPGKDLPPGLYFMAVEQRVKSGAGAALMAGQWFLASNLSLTAITAGEGVFTFAASGSSRPAQGALLQMTSQDGAVLAEALSNQDGVALLASPQDKKVKPVYITGVTAAGDVDIVDLFRLPEKEFSFSPRETALLLDRPLYQSGSAAIVTLFARDEEGRLQKAPASALKLLRPDFSLASEQPVPDDKAEAVTISVPLPVAAKAGEWHLLWQQTDGTVLAEKPFRLSPDGGWPKLEVTPARAMVEAEGRISLSLKATNERGAPFAWQGGFVEARVSRPEFGAFKGYHFGAEASEEDRALTVSKFMTKSDGTAEVHLKLQLPSGNHRAQAVTFKVMLDGGSEPFTMTLPVESPGGWVGIRALGDDQPMAETGRAAFGIMALDANLKRHAEGEVFYHLYEEGRSFDWRQAEGRWGYRPLPQHRRVNGGRLSLSADDAILELPVTAGNYVLEITDSEGNILAQESFRAGWDVVAGKTHNENELVFETVSTKFEPKRDNKIKLKLARPAMVSVVIGNGHVRQTLHRFMKAGEQTISVTPAETWKARGQALARAAFGDGSVAFAALPLSFRRLDQELEIVLTAPPRVVTGSALSLPVAVQKIEDRKKTFVAAQLTPLEKDGDSSLGSIALPPTALDSEGRATLRVNLPPYAGASRLVVRTWNDKQFGEKMLTLPSEPVLAIEGKPPTLLAVGDRAAFEVSLNNRAGADGTYAVDITAPDGLRLEGQAKSEIKLKRGEKRTLALDIIAEKEVRENVRLDIKGPANYHAAQSWPVAVRVGNVMAWEPVAKKLEGGESAQLPLEPGKREEKNAETTFVLVSPAPLPVMPRHWRELLKAEPFTTEELAHWLEAERMARSDILAFRPGADGVFRFQRGARIEELERRQNNDGGFSLWPSSDVSDMGSTAAAAMALGDDAPQAAQAALRWLQRRLENTWFEESERPARASAFLALASADRADMSALRYFADTSKDKEITPSVMAEIAQALSLGKDEAAARYWLDRARKALPRALNEQNPEVWSLMQRLAQNDSLEIKDIEGDIAAAASLQPETLEQSLALLRAVAVFVKRAGAWEITVDGQEKKQQGFYQAVIKEKEKPVTLKNTSSAPRYIVQFRSGKETKENSPEPPSSSKTKNVKTPVMQVERQIYRLDGSQVEPGAQLARGETYVVVVHGTGKLDETARMMPIVAVNPSTAGLRLIEAGSTQADVLAGMWPWLPQPLTGIEGAAVTPTAATFAFQPSGDWRFVFLMKAEASGSFSLPPVALRDLSGKKMNALQAPARFQVR